MRDLGGKAAFVTGAASGIGFALAEALAGAGMRVMLADIEPGPVEAARERLAHAGHDVRAVACDVTDAAGMEAAAEACVGAFGRLHVLCNNAGVAGGSGVEQISVETWRWVLDVNAMGIVNGVRAALPHMRSHGEGGHIVNTASMAGLQPGLGFSPYVASKYAAVAMSEGLALELAPHGIGVTVLCPDFVRTRIHESGRNRQAKFGPAATPDPASTGGQLAALVAANVAAGMDPALVARRALSAIRSNRLYAFTHPYMRAAVEGRFAEILAAMEHAGG